MKILSVEHHPEEDLIRRLRDVTMLKASGVFVYKKAFLSLEKIAVTALSPPQNYILRSELDKVWQLKCALAEHGQNIFELNGFLRLKIEGYEDEMDVLPPVVEESIENDGSVHLIINDGMHRLYMAMREWTVPQVIFIRGIPKDRPYYSFPLPGGWSNVEERDDLPVGYIKKWRRVKDYYGLYRNFNSSFLNVGGPRNPTPMKNS